MHNTTDIIKNVEYLYGSNSSLKLLKDFERVIDELHCYVYDNWINGELIDGPKDSKYWVTCTFMWPEDKMPDPHGGSRLLDYGCKVTYKKTYHLHVRKIKSPDDIRPGTKKGKIDSVKVWVVQIKMPKKLINDIDKGYREVKKSEIKDIVQQNSASQLQSNATEEQLQSLQGAIGGM